MAAAVEGDESGSDVADGDFDSRQQEGSDAGTKTESELAVDAAQSQDMSAIAQAEAQVDAAQANANTTHEALVGVQLAIKEVLAVSTSNIDNAHEGGANVKISSQTCRTLTKPRAKSNQAARTAQRNRARDKTAQAALLEAKKALAALKSKLERLPR